MRLSDPAMPFIPGEDPVHLANLAGDALHLNQVGMARTLRISRRTITRWYARHSAPSLGNLQDLARLVHPTDAALAARLAAVSGETLEGLGLVSPPDATAQTAAPPGATSRPFPPVPLLVDAIVCAAAEASQSTPTAMRGVLRAAFARARELGLTIEEVNAALSPPAPAAATRRGAGDPTGP